MIINDYYFNNEKIAVLISDINGNLKVYKTKNNPDGIDFKDINKSVMLKKSYPTAFQ